ncbi:hypothetical protein PIB30_101228, partial [Stylosanthes scabra]|nr:hypothetical protein [Stylosanthes scabra]
LESSEGDEDEDEDLDSDGFGDEEVCDDEEGNEKEEDKAAEQHEVREGATGDEQGSVEILNQFSTIHRRLLVAITFDPELRLTHRLRLHGAYHLLYASNLGL